MNIHIIQITTGIALNILEEKSVLKLERQEWK